MITYRKTKSGEWVAYGPLSELLYTGRVTVQKANGELVQETVVRLGHPFRVDGREMVYAYLAGKAGRPRQSSQRSHVPTYDCGHRVDRPVRGCALCEGQVGL